MSSLPIHRIPAPAFDGGTPTTASGVAARWLLAASRGLARCAVKLEARQARTCSATADGRTTPRLEFHSEQGSLQGAVYVDGRLLGILPGVKRL